MPFALGLQDSLRVRRREAPSEFAKGDSLERVLNRHLLAVEEMADGDLLTSILLLSGDGKRLCHGAAPNLPRSYREAIDGSEIGPCAGSCGTAAYLGRPIYVTDIATDPLWADYRHLAVPHGLRACWSTPIQDSTGAIIGTFAIYHRTIGSPTPDEIESIRMIADHVAEAIVSARDSEGSEERACSQDREGSVSRIGRDEVFHAEFPQSVERLRRSVDRLESHATDLDRCAAMSPSDDAADALHAAARECRRLASVIRRQIEP